MFEHHPITITWKEVSAMFCKLPVARANLIHMPCMQEPIEKLFYYYVSCGTPRRLKSSANKVATLPLDTVSQPIMIPISINGNFDIKSQS